MKNFIKNHLNGLIFSSIAILLPTLFGIIVWDKIPDIVPIHFNANGNADNFGNKAVLVFLIPIIMLATQWLLFFISSFDKRSKEQSKKVLSMVLWIIPITTFYLCGLMYSIVFGATVNFALLTGTFMGILLIVIGNYLPKCKPNGVVGIRMISTFSSVENWNKTHRLAGKCAVIGGTIIIVLSAICVSLAPETVLFAIFVPILLISVISPAVYSYFFYRKQLKNNEISSAEISKKLKPNSKKAIIISIIITVVTLALCSILLFSGDISFECSDTELAIVADFYGDISVKYEDIDSVELRENANKGSRVFGFGSPKLLMGNFKNNEFGNYTRYSYTKCNSEIVISSKGKILVISGKDIKKTSEIYNILIEKCN